MKTISLDTYGPVISNRQVGEEILTKVHQALSESNEVEVDLNAIKAMATFNAKQIFGCLYIEMGADHFFSRLKLSNTSEPVKLVIRMGIEDALKDDAERKANISGVAQSIAQASIGGIAANVAASSSRSIKHATGV